MSDTQSWPDFAAVYAATAPFSVVDLGPQYLISTPITIDKPITFRSAAGGRTRIIRKTIPGVSTALSIATHGVSFLSIDFDSDHPLGDPSTLGWNAKVGINVFRLYGPDFLLMDCTAANVDDFVFFEASASGAILHCRTNTTIRGDVVYIGGAKNIIIYGCEFAGSHCEHGIRIDQDSHSGANSAANITISSSRIGNFNGKESIATRTAKGPVTIIDCDLTAWTRAGQVVKAPAIPPVLSAGGVKYIGCRFHSKAFIQLDQGTPDSAVVACDFEGFAANVPVNIQGPNHTSFIAANTRTAMVGEKMNDPFHRVVDLAGADRVTEAATVETPAPPAIPIVSPV